MKATNSKTIRTDAKVLFAALKHPDVLYPARWKKASRKFVNWLRANDIPAPLIELYKQGTPTSYAQLGFGGLSSEKELIQENKENPNFLLAEFLIVGSASNGDIIAVDFGKGNGAAGYFSHELGPKELSPRQIRRDFRAVAPSLGAMVLGLVKDSVPIDYYWTWSQENEGRAQ